VAAKLYEDTKPDIYKTQPWLKPQWEAGKFSIGATGFNVSSVGDAFDLLTGGVKKLITHFNPFVKAIGNFFKDKKISDDTGAGQYKNLDIVTQKLVGYDAGTSTVNPLRRYLAELFGGPMLSNYQTLMDPKKSLTDIVNPFKTHEYDGAQLAAMYSMHFATGSGVPGPGGVLAVNDYRRGAAKQQEYRDLAEKVFQKAYDVGPGVYGKQRIVKKDDDGTALHNATQRVMKSAGDSMVVSRRQHGCCRPEHRRSHCNQLCHKSKIACQ